MSHPQSHENARIHSHLCIDIDIIDITITIPLHILKRMFAQSAGQTSMCVQVQEEGCSAPARQFRQVRIL